MYRDHTEAINAASGYTEPAIEPCPDTRVARKATLGNVTFYGRDALRTVEMLMERRKHSCSHCLQVIPEAKQ